MKTGRILKRAAALAVSFALVMSICACSKNSNTVNISDSTTDLMSKVKTASTNHTVETDPLFIAEYNNFAFSLFKRIAFNKAADSSNQDNSFMISPLSIMPALAVAANGANGETLKQMTEVLNGGSSDRALDLENLNRQLSAFVSRLSDSDKSGLLMANSIWLREGKMKAKYQFLKTNAEYYGANIYSSKFNADTVKDMNNWVSENTEGTIKKMLDEIPEYAVMYIINALSFDAEWKEIYSNDDIRDGEFNGTLSKQSVDIMSSMENGYLNDGNATGFIKPYASGYSFVAMLPNEDISINEYINSLDGDKLMSLIKNIDDRAVSVCIPKFRQEYNTELNGVLQQMGMIDAFDMEKADFSKMGDIESGENIYINAVKHKTLIKVDERGTKAGAMTSVEMTVGSSFGIMIPYVQFDRPFMYMIIENGTKLPIFIGMVMNVE